MSTRKLFISECLDSSDDECPAVAKREREKQTEQ